MAPKLTALPMGDDIVRPLRPLPFRVEVTGYRRAPAGDQIGLVDVRLPDIGLSLAGIPLLEDSRGGLRVGPTMLAFDSDRDRLAFELAVLGGIPRALREATP